MKTGTKFTLGVTNELKSVAHTTEIELKMF